MADEEERVEEKVEEEAGVVEEEDRVIVDLSAEEEKIEEKEPEKEEVEEEPEKKETKPHEEVDVEGIIDRVKAEVAPKEKVRVYSKQELDAAEDAIEAKLENEEIGRVQYRQLMRNVSEIRESQKESETSDRLGREHIRRETDRNITAWAENNAPEFINPRTKDYREGVQWAESTLGAHKNKDGDWVVSSKIFPVMAGILHRGQKGGDKEDAEKKGYEKGLKEEGDRKNDLRGKDTTLPKGKGKVSGAAPATARENEILESLNITWTSPEDKARKLARYRRMKDIGKSTAVIEVGG